MGKKGRIHGLQATYAALEESKRGPISLEPADDQAVALSTGPNKPAAAGLRRGQGGLAGHRRFTAVRGAGCTGVHPALAALRASATEITGMASTAKRRAGGFGRCAI